MLRFFSKPLRLVLLLAFGSFISVMIAAVRVVQVPMGWVPDDSLRLMVVPVAFFLHAVSGVMFGVLGPLQFAGVLRRRFGRWHRITGRAFVLGGLGLGLSGLALLARVDSIATPLLDSFRGFAGISVVIALAIGVNAARQRDLPRHRAWMIRSYALGMGTGTVALVMFPIYLINGTAPAGLWSDAIVVGWWLINIGLGEWVIRKNALPQSPRAAVLS